MYPEMLEDIDFKTGIIKDKNEEIPIEFNIKDDDENYDNDDFDNDDIIIEIIYESTDSSSNKASSEEDVVKDINPIDFVSESDTSSDKED